MFKDEHPPATVVAEGSRHRITNSSDATRLTDLSLTAGVDLWHVPGGDPYITLPVLNHREHHPLNSRSVRDWLSRRFHLETGRTAGHQAVQDALTALAGIARFEGCEGSVFVRVAEHEKIVYVDLGRSDWTVVAVTSEGWRVLEHPPVRFRRPRGMLPLPLPKHGGSLHELRALLHLDDENDWHLVASWLVGSLHPHGPYPVLSLCGEQGTAKSTTARMLRRIVDPSQAELRAEPRDVRDLMIAASTSWIVALDNVSHLPSWLSDALCRLSTGGALTMRQLYTDGDEHILEAVRPVILTGITDVVQRGDLQDRAITVTLPMISDNLRQTERDLWTKYDDVAPRVFGALLDAVACALKNESKSSAPALPRMADWAIWVTAAEPQLGWETGTGLAAYLVGKQMAIEASLDGDPLASALRQLKLPWRGTSTDLLHYLTPVRQRPPRGWPESARALSAALRRIAPQLRRLGVDVTFSRNGHDRRRLILLESIENNVNGTVRTVRTEAEARPAQNFSRDGRGD